jgi:putative DNA methylase
VALPLEAINRESAREKSIRHGHPSTLHLWWARRPLAACRAVLFASLVDDPSSLPDEFPTEEAQEKERQRLFRIIEELVKWEKSNNDEVLDRARAEIMKSTGGNPPPVLDPFCGGGSIPLEAQRLGLEAHGSDLNPVAVLITKALIEIPPKFAHNAPVNPESRGKLSHSMKWKGAQGLAEDVRYYGKWMRNEAEKRIGHLYPKVRLQDGREAIAIAWLWARTVKCPNPACGVSMPLMRTYALSTKTGNEVRVFPRVDGGRVVFDVRSEKGGGNEGTVGRTGAKCVACATDVDLEYIRREGRAGRLSTVMTAIVAEELRARLYVAPDIAQCCAAAIDAPDSVPDTPLPDKAMSFRVQAYGMVKHRDLFTHRQLTVLTTFSDLVRETRERVIFDAKNTMSDDGRRLADGGIGVHAYADAVATYLAFGVSKMADYNSSIVSWSSSRNQARSTFARQALPMVWDFCEVNPFARAAGDFEVSLDGISDALERLVVTTGRIGHVLQRDATMLGTQRHYAVSTDPPYYDNIGYADLSDFFYVWLRRSAGEMYPQITSTLLVPKTQELIASRYRFGGDDEAAKEFFETGLLKVFENIRMQQVHHVPLTVYYAFKQAEEDSEEDIQLASTGWETMLEGLVQSGFSIVGTWPVRTERGGRSVSLGTNALASSIVLVCRPRSENASIATRRQFIAALKSKMPDALKKLQQSSIAATDLEQAVIGPGMAVFSSYSKVIEADGSPMRVRGALQLINQAVDEVRSEHESEYDPDTQWAIAWFDQFGTSEAPFGEAETLSKAKNISVGGLVDSGLLRAAKGKVQLIGREHLDVDWDPTMDRRLTIWEVTQHLIARLKSGGEQEAANLLRKVGDMGETARDLAYRLYSICSNPKKGWTEEAIAYNSLVVAWPEITRIAAAGRARGDEQSGGQASLI